MYNRASKDDKVKNEIFNNIWIRVLCLLCAFYLYFLFAHFVAPLGILFFPLFLAGVPIATNYVFVGLNIFVKSAIATLLLFFSDILLRDYAGGTHDSEGNGVIILFFFFGLIPFFVMEVIFIINNRSEKRKSKVKSMVFILGFQIPMVIAYVNYFGWYGMEIEVTTDTINEAKAKDVFLTEYEIVKNTWINENDTIIIKEAWLEKKVRISHKELIKRKYETGALELRLTFHRSSNKNYNPVMVIDTKTGKSDSSFSNDLYMQSDRSIINRNQLVLKLNYESISDSIVLRRMVGIN